MKTEDLSSAEQTFPLYRFAVEGAASEQRVRGFCFFFAPHPNPLPSMGEGIR